MRRLDLVELFKQEVTMVTEQRDISKFEQFYSKDLQVISNNRQYTHDEFKQMHAYEFEKVNRIEAQIDDIFAQENNLAVKLSFNRFFKEGGSSLIHLVALVKYQGNLITHMWQMIYPLSEEVSTFGSPLGKPPIKK